MSEEKHHRYLFGHHQKEDEDTISDDATFAGEETYVGRDYSAKAAHTDIHDYSQTTEETDEDYESQGRVQKEHLDEYEKHESEETGHVHKPPIEEEKCKITISCCKYEKHESEETGHVHKPPIEEEEKCKIANSCCKYEKHESEEIRHVHKPPIEEEEKISLSADSKVEEDEVEEAVEKKKSHLF